ncbi:hypothetical protein [Paenibacillus rigui]|uniref:DUF4083 domain-containing protein n=1 Tax=Paenibacillus rigui TaxID=554312 RepID=A0A229UG88_9BACL|nr:hypothetical protein [Paenibacillus rigui]OXM82360.1 hypothetical protein CF651_31490 [Paenibacillus rigui]
MGALSPIHLIMLLISWVFGAAVIIFIIRYAINTSKLVAELSEIKREVRLLREEMSKREEQL